MKQALQQQQQASTIIIGNLTELFLLVKFPILQTKYKTIGNFSFSLQ